MLLNKRASRKKPSTAAPSSYDIGKQAEDMATAYLEAKHYTTLARRMRTRYGEIDIIALSGTTVVMVEVKMRKHLEDYRDAVTPRQQKRINQSALMYIAEHPEYQQHDIRMDVVFVTADGQIEHLENAWGEC